MPLSETYNEDCMVGMSRYPDKYFELAIVDPMYDMDDNYLVPGADVSTTGIKRKFNQQAKSLAALPIVQLDYYNELVRVSKHQIIWGINYFEFAGKIRGRIVWDKKNDESTFSNAELASCSLIQGVRMFRYRWNGMLQEDMKNKEIKIHPFHKPIALYRWCLNRYAKPGDKILDTHLGSGSSRIAAFQMGFDFYGWEIDKDYFEAQKKRFKEQTAQQSLFNPENLRA